jgi:hypothetical protein
MRFYKICHRGHPTNDLPSVQWDPRTEKPLFEFVRTDVAGVLGCDISDPELIDMLTSAGYVTERPDSPNIPGMALMHRRPLAGEDGHEEIKLAEEMAGRREK